MGSGHGNPTVSHESRQLAVLFCGAVGKTADLPSDVLYIIMNAHWEPAAFEPPQLPGRIRWHLAFNTSAESPQDSYPPGDEIRLASARFAGCRRAFGGGALRSLSQSRP